MRALGSILFFFIIAMVVYELFAVAWHFPFFSWFLLIPVALAFLLPWSVDTVNRCCKPKENAPTAHAH